MDPIHASAVYDSRAVSLVYEPLLEVDYEARPYRLKACACDLPEVSASRTEYTFRLRDGLRFQDDACFPGGKGRAATAEDVVFSLGRLRNPTNASSGMWTMDYVKEVKAVDARTVSIELKKPFHVFPWLMAMAYSAVVPHEAVEAYGDKFGQHAVGTGPYRLAEWWRNYRMVFTRDVGWRGWAEVANPAPYEKIEYVVVNDLSTQWLMFLGKELDCLGGVDRNNWDAVVGPDGKLVPSLAVQGVRLLAAPTLQVMYVGVNMDDPLLGKNKKLRQALNCAFDAPAWKKFLNDRVEPADGPLPPGVDGRLETPFAYAFNVEKAKALLVEAGYPGGIDPKTGKRLVIPIALGRADQGAREEVELLQGFYDRVGIKLEPQFMTWAAYLKAVSDGHTTLFMLGWVGDYPDAENFLQLFHSKNCSPGANHGNYRNPEFDKCYDEAMAAATPEARQAAWARAQEIVREDCPWIFLYFPKAYSIIWDHVGNYRLTDFPYGTEKYLRAGK
jgi:ABC-type transport system substrate-binding protein